MNILGNDLRNMMEWLGLAAFIAVGLFLVELDSDMRSGGYLKNATWAQICVNISARLTGCMLGAWWMADIFVFSVPGCNAQYASAVAGVGGVLGWRLLDAVSVAALSSVDDLMEILKRWKK